MQGMHSGIGYPPAANSFVKDLRFNFPGHVVQRDQNLGPIGNGRAFLGMSCQD